MHPTGPELDPRLHSPSLGPVASPKSYARAVVLSGVFGWSGLQHVYLGRPGLALLDLGLSVGWLVAFVTGRPLLGAVLLVLDFGHGLLVTVQLLTGSFRDGQGRVVCYPGQKLGGIASQPNCEMRRSST